MALTTDKNRTSRPRRSVVALLATSSLALAGASPAAAACPGEDAQPGSASPGVLRAATLCLLNEERSRRGKGRLADSPQLAAAADRHARDMVERRYFSHDSISGQSFVNRIMRTGYGRSARSWSVGENLAWGTGTLATPRAIHRSWMESPGHRANILNGRYGEVGVGLALGSPTSSPRGAAATYATEFGRRR